MCSSELQRKLQERLKVRVFSLPRDEELSPKWLRAIRREGRLYTEQAQQGKSFSFYFNFILIFYGQERERERETYSGKHITHDFICMYVFTQVCMYLHMYVCTYVYLFIYLDILYTYFQPSIYLSITFINSIILYILYIHYFLHV